MWAGASLKLLADFVSGQLKLSDFRRELDDQLFTLRQNPAMTEEKRLLSTIQLYLHETEEGHRSTFEVYMLARSILDRAVIWVSDTQSSPPQHIHSPVREAPVLTQDADISKENTFTRFEKIDVPA